MKILITGGGTLERIDDVRSITNFSTGSTAALLADIFCAKGAQVTLLHGKQARIGKGHYERVPFESFKDLDQALQNQLMETKFHAVIHLAAVSDYSLDSIEIGGIQYKSEELKKIDSSDRVSLHLKRNYKILDRLKTYAHDPHLLVVGFKLTSRYSENERREAVLKVLKSGEVDYVVQNDLQEIDSLRHLACLYDQSGKVILKTNTKEELAEALFDLLESQK